MARGTAENLDMVDLKPRFKASPVIAKTEEPAVSETNK